MQHEKPKITGRPESKLSARIPGFCDVPRTMAQIYAYVGGGPAKDKYRTRKTVESLVKRRKLVNIAQPLPGRVRPKEGLYLDARVHAGCASAAPAKAAKPAARDKPQPAPGAKRADRTPVLGWHIGADLAKAWGIRRPAP
jgi:hypothetical protein